MLDLSSGELIALLDDNPRYRTLLVSALAWERTQGASPITLGFAWHDIAGGSPSACNRLVTEGVLRVSYKSRTRTDYRLALAAEVVEEALRVSLGMPEPVAEEEEIPADLFDIIEGQERAKSIARAAIEADRPVHLLLEGPPGTAKTLFLQEFSRLPGAAGPFVLGNTTRAGLLGLLREQPCRYLLLDEIDKRGTAADLSTLLSVMETGLLTELKHGRRLQERRHVWVFAGANRVDRLPAEFLSRCVQLRFRVYTTDEFRRVSEAVLVRREGLDPELAAEIAARMERTRTRDPRDPVKIARMCRGDRQRALALIEEVFG